jgi:hypothetical protein
MWMWDMAVGPVEVCWSVGLDSAPPKVSLLALLEDGPLVYLKALVPTVKECSRFLSNYPYISRVVPRLLVTGVAIGWSLITVCLYNLAGDCLILVVRHRTCDSSRKFL